jgi:hypothetical protein
MSIDGEWTFYYETGGQDVLILKTNGILEEKTGHYTGKWVADDKTGLMLIDVDQGWGGKPTLHVYTGKIDNSGEIMTGIIASLDDEPPVTVKLHWRAVKTV